MNIALAIDIGGSKCLIGLVDENGQILKQDRFEWEKLEKISMTEQIVDDSRKLIMSAGVVPTVMGVTIPGLADPEKGIWIEASFSGIRDWSIAEDLEKRLGYPCFADNDANAAALAEYSYGGAKGLTDFLYITVSNGIGGAAFCGGKLLRASNNNVMEIGHCMIVENGRLCGCGNRGCLEMHASGRAIAMNYAEYGGSSLPDGSMPQCREIAQRAALREPIALRVFEDEGKYLGEALATACNMFNPQEVFLGGGVSMVFDLFRDSLTRNLQKHLYRKANASLKISATKLGYHSALLGAAAVAFSGI